MAGKDCLAGAVPQTQRADFLRPRQDMTLPILNAAFRIRKTRGFSFWDCAIVAAALALGRDRVYTEDLAHGQVVDGLAIIDPFR
jgi:predicted nucleic acid-binding protein